MVLIFTDMKTIISYLQCSILWVLIKARWAYMHIHPHYAKWSLTGEEWSFQNVRTGTLHNDLRIAWPHQRNENAKDQATRGA